MWLFPTLGALGRCYRECQRSRGVFSYEHFQTWGPSVPVAIVTGFFCAYVWVRIRPYFTDDPDELQQVADSHDFKDVRTFLNGLHEQMIDMWYTTFGWTPRNPRPQDTNRNGKQIQELKHQTRSSTTETISKEGEDMLLSKRPTDGEMRSQLTESILGTMAFKSHVAREDVTTLKQRLNDMSGGQVHQVAETSYVLQTRLPITPDLLTEALALAQYGAALDPQCTLQLGSWGIIVHRGDKLELLKFQGGPVPVVLDASRETEHELRVEGLFLEGVQMRAATSVKNIPLTSKSLIKGGFAHDQGAGWMDVLFIEEPPRHEIGLDSSVVYATKSVDFEGSPLTLRSGFVHVGFQPKPRKSQDSVNIFLLGMFILVIAMLPRSFWWPIFGKVVLPVLQLAALSVGWVLGRYVLLGEWPFEKKHESMMDMGNLQWSEHGGHPSSVPKTDNANVRSQMIKKFETQPSASNSGVDGRQTLENHTDYWQKTLVEMNRAVQLEPQNDLPLRIRGCLKGLTCDYHGAIVDLNSAIEHRHDSRAIPAYVERGVFKFLQGDCEGAVVDFDTAIHYGPEQPLEVIRLRSLVRKILDDRRELAMLKTEIGQLKSGASGLQSSSEKVEKFEKLDEVVDKVSAQKASVDKAVKQFPPSQTMDLQYNSLCCESCISKIKTALLKMPDVESVSVDMYANRVSVTGRVAPPKLLQVSSKMSPNKVITLIPADSESEINLLPGAEEMSMLEFNSTASSFPATP